MRHVVKGLPATLAAAMLALGVAGCSEDKATSTTGPNADTLQPRGTLQGYLVDSVTLQPIVGAVVDIGVGEATTDARGQYVISNVPATTDALNGTTAGAYLITIDLQRVTSPVNMATATGAVYPKFSYSAAQVVFTSLDDTSGGNAGGGSGTNHDTPVTGLVATKNLNVGKLAATFTGVVAGCSGDAFYTPVGLGYRVNLVAAGATTNSATGSAGNVVQSVDTAADGSFTFTNVESLGQFFIRAVSADGMEKGFADADSGATAAETAFVAPADGQTTTLSIQASNAVHVCSIDIHGPEFVGLGITDSAGNAYPEAGVDLPATGATQVSFVFSEPVLQTAKMTTIPGVPGNLFEQIEVVSVGPKKGGNLAYTLNWNATFDVLTVDFTTAPSSLYYVRLKNVGGVFADQFGNDGGMGLCQDDEKAPVDYDITAPDADLDDCTVWFSTNGSAAAAQVAAVVVVNANTLNATGTTPVIDWLPVAGAIKYDVFRTITAWPGTPEALVLSNELVGTVDITEFADSSATTGATARACAAAGCEFIKGDAIPLQFTYTVIAKNLDGEPAAASPPATAADKVAPKIASAAITISDADASIKVTFNEDMIEGAAETQANYAITTWGSNFATPVYASATSAGQYATKAVTLMFTNIEYAIVPGASATCSSITPAVGTDDQAASGAMVVGEATCVKVGSDNVATAPYGLQTTPAGDDNVCGTAGTVGYGICAGADGVCNTNIASGDVQTTNSGLVPKCIVEGANGLLETTPAGTDRVLSAIRGVALQNGIKDVGGNSIDVRYDAVTAQNGVVGGAFVFAP